MKKIRNILCAAGLISACLAMPVLAAEAWGYENGQFVSAGGTAIEGALEKGITVSKYQNRAGTIDWNAVAGDHVSFAMVRLGYHNDLDPYFDQNMKDAKAHGIKTGVFFYTQALDVATAEDEARFVLDVVKDYPISYPIAYDVESQYLLDNGLTPAQIAQQVNAFCSIISDAGYRPIVYGNNQWLTEKIDTASIPYDIWYARYGSVNNYQNRTIWQCTDSGQVNGITGNVCIEFSFTDYSQLIPGTGWKQINGKWYYFVDYQKVSNTVMEIDGVSYQFGNDGAWVQ